MSVETKISSKGQVVIPKDVRDKLRWTPGTALELIETPDGVAIRAKHPDRTLTVDEALARIRDRTAPYRPPSPVPVEEISSVSEAALREHFLKEYPPRRRNS